MDLGVALILLSAFALAEFGIILILLGRPKAPVMRVEHKQWIREAR